MRYGSVISALLIIATLLSCGKSQGVEPDGPELTVLIGTDGYGDGCYNDNMLAGIVSFCEAHPQVRLTLEQPTSIADAGKRLDAWLADEKPVERAMILASNSYEGILKGKSAPKNGRVLILETDDLFPGHSSYIIRRYGASWLCGAMSKEYDPIILKAMDGNDMIDESALGYTEGFRTVSDRPLFSWTVADGPEGFSMRDSVYRFVYNHVNDEVFSQPQIGTLLFFPLLGGSLPGVFDYGRYNGFVNIVGMDTDCSAYNPYMVPFSLTLSNDRALKHYLEDWLAGTPWPEHTVFGMESGFVQVVINSKYKMGGDDFQARYQEFYSQAIEKEEAYEVE